MSGPPRSGASPASPVGTDVPTALPGTTIPAMLHPRASSIALCALLCLVGSEPTRAQWMWKLANGTVPSATELIHPAGGDYYASTMYLTLKSTDLNTWSYSPIAPGGLRNVALGDSLWMGVTGHTLVVYKGNTQITAKDCKSSAPTATTFDGTRFVALFRDDETGTDATTTWSPDKGWEVYPRAQISEGKGMAWGNGTFLAITYSNHLYTAKADLSWKAATSTDTAGLSLGPVFHAGLFVARGKGNRIVSSPDGITWTPRTTGGGATITRLAVRGGSLFALGDSGTILESPDGIAWSTLAKPCAACNVADLASDGGKLAIVARGRLCRSDDGASWSCQVDSIPRPTLFKVAHIPGHFLAISDSGRIFHSPDGANWTEKKALPEYPYFEFIAARGKFHALDPHGYVKSTVDGSSWTSSYIGYSYVYTLAEGGGQFMVTGDKGLVFVSDSLKTWTEMQPLLARDSTSFSDISTLKMFHDGKRFVSGTGKTTGMYTSVDGKYWRSAGCAQRLIDVVHVHDTIGLAASSLGSTCRSVDGGASWSDGPNRNILDATWADTSFVAVGKSGIAATTRDGLVWTDIPRLSSTDLNSVAYGEGTLVAVGVGGTIIYATSAKTTAIQGRSPEAAKPRRRFLVGHRDGVRTLRCETTGRLEMFDAKGQRILPSQEIHSGDEIALPRSFHGILTARLVGKDGVAAGTIAIP